MAPPLQPWFRFERPALCSAKIVFGHWAALQGRDCGKNLFALDTGCIWGGPLRAMKLETQEYSHFFIRSEFLFCQHRLCKGIKTKLLARFL